MSENKKANKTILVTGSNGFVGSCLCPELVRRGNSVIGVKRSCNEMKGSETPFFKTMNVCDIGPETNWASALVGVDAVVHLAARVHIMRVDDTAVDPMSEFRKVNVDSTRRLAEEAARAGVKRLVFISSIKVNGEKTDTAPPDQRDRRCSGSPFNEEDLPHPEDPYGISKWEAEKVLRDIEKNMGIEVVIIRPPLIYGPGVKANFLKLIQLVEYGIPLPFGKIQNKRSFLNLSNLVDLICCCLDRKEAAGETFLASDGDDVSTPELVRRIAKAMGKPARLLPIPKWMISLAGMAAGRSDAVMRLCDSLQINSCKARQVLGWTAPYTMADELTRVAAWRLTV